MAETIGPILEIVNRLNERTGLITQLMVVDADSPYELIKVMDFGLARSMEATGMTQAGTVMGTPAYMSPEQAKGMPADERSDLFSLGIIAYQMLTGVVPYKADSALASMLPHDAVGG